MKAISPGRSAPRTQCPSRPPGRSSAQSSSLNLPCLPNEIFTPLNVYPVESFFYSTGDFAFIQLGRSIFHRGGISRSEPTAGGIPPGSSSPTQSSLLSLPSGISRSEPTAGGIPPGSSSLIIAPQGRRAAPQTECSFSAAIALCWCKTTLRFDKFLYGFLRVEIPALRDQYSSAPRPNFQ